MIGSSMSLPAAFEFALPLPLIECTMSFSKTCTCTMRPWIVCLFLMREDGISETLLYRKKIGVLLIPYAVRRATDANAPYRAAMMLLLIMSVIALSEFPIICRVLICVFASVVVGDVFSVGSCPSCCCSTCTVFFGVGSGSC